MSAPVLQHKHIFGLKADVTSNLHYVEENMVIYAAGHNLIIYDMETRIQRFIHGSDVNGPQGHCEITCMAVSPNKRYVALAERGLERASISVYDIRTLKKRKTLSTPDCHSREYVSICFSPDNKNIISQGGSPDWILINWLWSKSKPMNQIRVDTRGISLNQCSFCPSDASLVCVSGRHTLQFMHIEEEVQNMKLLEADNEENHEDELLCHSWISGKKLVVGTAKGELLFYEDAMYRSRKRASEEEKSVTTIQPFNKGFVLGCEDGIIRVFEASSVDKLADYLETRIFTIASHSSRVKTLAISPSEEHLACTLESGQAFKLNMFNTDVLKSEDMKFEPIVELFHTGPITGLDVCARKPIVATCGTDKTVRIWNYQSRSAELVCTFADTPQSIALHPSGLYVLIGFTDKLRLCNILMDDIRCFREFPIKGCMECQFSHGGQYFAAVNTGLIQVYSTYTCDSVAVFRGHTGNVRSLYWSLDDSAIISAGVDGAVYERRLDTPQQRTQEYVQKGCKFTSALCTEDRRIYAVGDDCILKEISERNVQKTLDAGVILTQLVISYSPQRMLFAGTANGVIRSFQFPLTGDVKDYQCHCKEVTRMRITNDDTYLFSISEDGCLAMFACKELDGKPGKRERPDILPFSEEILVTKSDLEEKNSTMSELKSKVEELTASNEYQLRLHDMNYHEKLKEVSEKFNLNIQHDKSKIEMLRDEKVELEIEFDEKLQQLQIVHANRLHAQDLDHQKEIMSEVGVYQKLQEEMEEDVVEYKNQVREREASHNADMMALREEFDDKLQAERTRCKGVMTLRDSITREFVETTSQLEEDADKEIEQLKKKYDTKLHLERDATLRLKGENGIMKKKFSALQKDIEDQRESIKEMVEEEKKLSNYIKKLEDRIQSHKEEIEERDRTIGEKEKQIYELKKCNQELEKHKFVLDFRIKELKRQIEPRENEIADMKDRVMKMDGQLETYHKDNKQLQADVNSLKTTLRQKQADIAAQRTKARNARNALDELSRDMFALVQNIQDPEVLLKGTALLYKTHVTDVIEATVPDPVVSAEYSRQREHLESTMKSLKTKLQDETKSGKRDNTRIMQENVSLLKEIHKMRREIKALYQDQRQRDVNNATAFKLQKEVPWNEAEAIKILQMQREQIDGLRQKIGAR